MTTATVAAIFFRQQNGIGPQHPTQVVAASLSLVSGNAWVSLCCWCLDEAKNTEREAHRVRANFGECDACPYVGRDCLVVAPVGVRVSV